MAWSSFTWGSRGEYWDTGLGVYVAHIFIEHGVQVSLFGVDKRGDELLHVFDCEAVNVLPDVNDCRNIAIATSAWVSSGANPFNAMINEEINVVRVVAQSIAEFEGPYWEQDISQFGVRAGTAAPSVLTVNLKKSGANSGRSRRGYFAAWPAVLADLDSTDKQLWGASYCNDLVDCYNDLASLLGSGSYPLVIASRARATLYPVTGITMVTRAVRNRHSRAALIGR